MMRRGDLFSIFACTLCHRLPVCKGPCGISLRKKRWWRGITFFAWPHHLKIVLSGTNRAISFIGAWSFSRGSRW